MTTTDPTVTVHRADGSDIFPVTIAIGPQMPDHRGQGWEQRHRDLFTTDARALADVLHNNLPGGTFVALLAEMLDRKACLLRVPLPTDPTDPAR